MVSLPRDQTAAKIPALPELAKSTVKAGLAGLDTELMFRLIDSILPFEACLYHQILPLSLEGSRLKLGMVNLDDSTALDYVRRILAYMNCSLTPQTLSSEVHHAVLTAYLNYSGSKNKKQSTQSPTAQSDSIADSPQKSPQAAANGSSPDKNSTENHSTAATAEKELSDGRAQLDRQPIDRHQTKHDQNNAPTFLVDSPDDLNFQDLEVANPAAPPVISSTPDTQASDPPHILTSGTNASIDSSQLSATASDTKPSATNPPQVPLPGEALPLLHIEPKYLSNSVDVLATLPPAQLLEELLGRVLVGGIGRLYFEQQPHYGRILWSQNGVLQSVLEELPVEIIQGMINELKLLTCLPLIPVEKPKQVEIERLHQNQRLLLRLRVMPGKHGEEATVQVLRGAALKFYQQQQLASLSRDALTTAQDLQRKVNELRVRTRFYPLISPEQLSILPALDNVLKSIDQQLEALKVLQISEPPEVDD